MLFVHSFAIAITAASFVSAQSWTPASDGQTVTLTQTNTQYVCPCTTKTPHTLTNPPQSPKSTGWQGGNGASSSIPGWGGQVTSTSSSSTTRQGMNNGWPTTTTSSSWGFGPSFSWSDTSSSVGSSTTTTSWSGAGWGSTSSTTNSASTSTTSSGATWSTSTSSTSSASSSTTSPWTTSSSSTSSKPHYTTWSNSWTNTAWTTSPTTTSTTSSTTKSTTSSTTTSSTTTSSTTTSSTTTSSTTTSSATTTTSFNPCPTGNNYIIQDSVDENYATLTLNTAVDEYNIEFDSPDATTAQQFSFTIGSDGTCALTPVGFVGYQSYVLDNPGQFVTFHYIYIANPAANVEGLQLTPVSCTITQSNDLSCTVQDQNTMQLFGDFLAIAADLEAGGTAATFTLTQVSAVEVP